MRTTIIASLFLVALCACGVAMERPDGGQDAPTCYGVCPDLGPMEVIGPDINSGDDDAVEGNDSTGEDGSVDDNNPLPDVITDATNPNCPSVMPEICGKDMMAYCDKTVMPDPACQGGKGLHGYKLCKTDEECQTIPPDKLPPCVCWGKVPCTLAAWDWQCPSSTATFDLALWPQDDSCIVGGGYFFKPGMDKVQVPLKDPFEMEIIILEGGDQFQSVKNDGNTAICTKKVKPN